jgi:hypothetical protein
VVAARGNPMTDLNDQNSIQVSITARICHRPHKVFTPSGNYNPLQTERGACRFSINISRQGTNRRERVSRVDGSGISIGDYQNKQIHRSFRKCCLRSTLSSRQEISATIRVSVNVADIVVGTHACSTFQITQQCCWVSQKTNRRQKLRSNIT